MMTLVLVIDAIMAFSLLLALFSLLNFIMFNNIFAKKCMNIKVGIFALNNSREIICGISKKCELNFYCINKWSSTIDIDNFDSFSNSFINTLRIFTFDNWTDLMNKVQNNFTYFASIFFIFTAVVGNFFLINFILVVFKVSFTDSLGKFKEKNLTSYQIQKKIRYNLKEIKEHSNEINLEFSKILKFSSKIGFLVIYHFYNQIFNYLSIILKKLKNN